MAQFGAGPELAAQCPRVPTPDGWRPWLDSDGPIPDGLSARAKALVADASVPLGATESYPIPGVTTLIVVVPQAWGRDANGNLVEGCFRVGGVYLPSGTPSVAVPSVAPPAESGTAKAVGVFTVISLAVGTAATLITLKRKK